MVTSVETRARNRMPAGVVFVPWCVLAWPW
jgi:hypothetical protein